MTDSGQAENVYQGQCKGLGCAGYSSLRAITFYRRAAIHRHPGGKQF